MKECFYWNKLPEFVEAKESINSFSNALDTFEGNGIIKKITKPLFWNSQIIFYKGINLAQL